METLTEKIGFVENSVCSEELFDFQKDFLRTVYA